MFTFICVIFFFMGGCGFGPSQQQKPVEKAIENIPDAGSSDEFNSVVKPVLQANCALSGCHSGVGFTLNSSDYINSNAPKRIINGSMPPSYSPKYGQWGREEKKIVLDWYDDNM